MYESFARVYDTFMDEVPYDEWADFLVRELREDGIRDGLVLDLGCGTGQMTRRLSLAGYDMIGVDRSVEMLEIAQERKGRCDILYLLQDVRQFELYGTVRAVISTCDSLNYITDREDLLAVFRLVNNYLDPGGLFLFDLNSAGYYEKLCADNVFAESRDECSFIWENSYDPRTSINEYDLTLFLQREDGLYERFLETHRERAWTIREINAALLEAGMKPEGARLAYGLDEAKDRPARTGSLEVPAGFSKNPNGASDNQAASSGKWMAVPPEILDRGSDRILLRARESGKQ